MFDGARDRVSPADQQVWAQAHTLQDIGDRTALWLEGQLTSRPGYPTGYGPDEETSELVPVLARLNRAGFLTTASQPGFSPEVGVDGGSWAQRPAVEGFVHPGSLLESIVALRDTNHALIVRAVKPRRVSLSRRITVTTRNRLPYSRFGARHNPYLRDRLCPLHAAIDIGNATHLTLVDRRYQATNNLWDALDAVTIGPTNHDQ